MNDPIKIGTRGSKLALWQANWVKSVLEEKFPPQTIELIIIKTRGDKILDVPLAKVGGKGLFVKEIERKDCMGGPRIRYNGFAQTGNSTVVVPAISGSACNR